MNFNSQNENLNLENSNSEHEKFVSYPLNNAQKTIWKEFLSDKNVTHNISFLMKIDSWIDMERLKKAFATALNNHSFLKSRIKTETTGEPYLYKAPLNEEQSTDFIEEIHKENTGIEEIQNYLSKPFNSFEEPLFRVKIIYAKGIYVFIDAHKIICDISSIYIYLEDVSQAYLKYDLEKEKINGYELSRIEYKQRNSETYYKAKDYYSNILKNSFPSQIKKDLFESKEKRIATLELVSRRCITDMVRRFCSSSKISMHSFFSAVFGFLLGKYNNCTKSIFNNVYDGRNASHLKNTVCLLEKTFPVVTDTENETTSKGLLHYIKEIESQIADSQNNNAFSIEEINKELGIKPDILLVFHNENYNFASFCGKISKQIKIQTEPLNCSLRFQISLCGAEVTYNADYNPNSYSQNFIEYFLDSFDMAVSEFMVKTQINEIETTSYKSVKSLRNFNNPLENYKSLIKADKKRAFSFLKSKKEIKLYILDKYKKLVPIGAFGRLYISASEVSSELKTNLNLSEQDLIENPFASDGFEQIIDTHFIVRWLSDGSLEFR